jgi:hypothetical protein
MIKLRDRLEQHIRQLAPHIQNRETSLLLIEARDMLTAQASNAETGAAIERAAKDLPERYDISIEIEQGAGIVKLYTPDSDSYLHEWEADTFGGQINAAINYALENKHG